MDNYLSGNSIPLGFGMALAQNTAALDAFSSLSKEEQQAFINGAQNVRSKQEMRSYVNSITNQSF